MRTSREQSRAGGGTPWGGRAVPVAPAILAVLAILALLAIPAPRTAAQQEGVAATLHNLSVSGPGEVRSLTESEVCKFCHVPHTAVAPEPLWGHALSRVQTYAVPQIRSGVDQRQAAPQPGGSSRLCLSCHDGTVALGEIAGESRPIPMVGGDRLRPGQRGYLGTDLSGGHPISFVMPDMDPAAGDPERDMGIKPRGLIRAEGVVQLDEQGKMQCTTCHDPHLDVYFVEGRVPHFWVQSTVTEVCLACHEPR